MSTCKHSSVITVEYLLVFPFGVLGFFHFPSQHVYHICLSSCKTIRGHWCVLNLFGVRSFLETYRCNGGLWGSIGYYKYLLQSYISDCKIHLRSTLKLLHAHWWYLFALFGSNSLFCSVRGHVYHIGEHFLGTICDQSFF